MTNDQVREVVGVRQRIKRALRDDHPLFGEGLGLDSLDAVELVVLLKKHYQTEIKDMDEARKAFASITALAEYIRAHRTES